MELRSVKRVCEKDGLKPMIKVYYDDKCGLCQREIEYYRSKSKPELIQWRKLSEYGSDLAKHNISHENALKMLHALSHDGRLVAGVDAFILIWQQIARWKWLAVFVGLPGIYQLSKMMYRGFAHWRFNRLDHCVIDRNV